MTDTREPRLEIDLRERDRRVWDRLRSRIVAHGPGEGSGLLDLALLAPDFAVLLARLARDPRVPFRAKLIAAAGLGYALSPIDFLPEILLGPLGLLDDVVIAAAALSRVLNHVHPDLVRSHWSGQGDALEAVQRITSWCESTLGSAAARVLGFRNVVGPG